MMVFIFILLNILDLITTYLVISSGKGTEANKLAKWVLDKAGWIGMSALKGVVIVGALVLGPSAPPSILTALSIMYAVVVINNYRIYRK